MYAMRDAKGKKPKDIFPEIFADDDEEEISDETHYTHEDMKQIKAEMEFAKELFKKIAEIE